MSHVEKFDSYVEAFNSSARLIRTYLASQPADGHGSYARQQQQQLSEADILARAPDQVRRARQSIFNATIKIQQQLSGPIQFCQQMNINAQQLACLLWLMHFDIPSHVPQDSMSSISYEALALSAKVPLSHLKLVVRMAMTNGVFQAVKSSPQYVKHNALSYHMAVDKTCGQTLQLLTKTVVPTAMKMPEMTTRFKGGEKPNETAHNIAFHTDLPFYEYLRENPTAKARFESGMKSLGGVADAHIEDLVQGFDWAGLGEAYVVDVGGSTGHVSIALAKAFPKLRFTVQDLPEVISKAKAMTLPADVAGRVDFIAHDYLSQQPPSSKRADVFLLRLVVQEHPRAVAPKILRKIESKMKDGAVILLNNRLLPPPDSLGVREESLGMASSLYRLQATNEEYLDEQGFEKLIYEAGCDLKIREVRRGGGNLALIVVEKMPASDSS